MTKKSDLAPVNRDEDKLVVRLGPGMKAEWVTWCKERDLMPGKTVRLLVETAMAEGLELTTMARGARVKVKVLEGADEGPRVERRMSLTPSEDAAIHAVAEAQGFGFHEWVIAAVRAALANSPTYGQVEMEAMTKSNSKLVQIAADLAYLRRTTVGQQSLELLDLERGIKAHIVTASHTLAQGARRWQLKI